jgi:peptide/nickel transport system ATP-binding protein
VPPGCAYHERCPLAADVCSTSVPELVTAHGRSAACHFRLPGAGAGAAAAADDVMREARDG